MKKTLDVATWYVRGGLKGSEGGPLMTAFFFRENGSDNSDLFQTFARSAQIGKAHFHDSGGVKFFEERAERAVAFISQYVLLLLA